MAARVERVDDTAEMPAVRGWRHLPATPSGHALVLTHGAGSDANAPLLVALAEAFAGHGWSVLRCDLPYRQARPHGPPHGSGAEDRAGLRRAAELSRPPAPGRVFLGGVSYGGRQATMLAAEEPGVCDGLLVLSYPLHPPGKPEQLRTAHLPKLQAPALFVSGTADPFASPAELEAALRLVPTHPSLLVIEHAGHDLGFGRRAKTQPVDLPERIVEAFAAAVARRA
jgi:uncharacterized protein